MHSKFLLLLVCLACFLPGRAEVYPVTKIAVAQGLSNNFVNSITIDEYDNVWLATEEGLMRIDGSDLAVYQYNPAKLEAGPVADALNVVLAAYGRVWIGSQRHGLSVFDYDTGSFTHYKHDPQDPESISTDDITALEIAPDGKLWVGTYHRGVELFDPATGKCKHYNASVLPQMPANQVQALLSATNGKLYIGHFENGVTVLDPATGQVQTFNSANSGLPGDKVKDIKEDARGNIFFGTNKGIGMLPAAQSQIQALDIVLPGGHDVDVKSLQPTGQNLLASIDGYGVVVIDIPTGHLCKTSFTHGKSSNQIGGSTVTDMAIDRFDNLWLATWGGGVNLLGHGRSPFEKYGNEDGLQQMISVLSLGFDPDGGILVGADGDGLLSGVVDSSQDVEARKFAQLDDGRILAQWLDSNKRLWVSQYRGGVVVLDPSGRKAGNVPIATEARCFYQRGDSMWIGTTDGIYIYDINTLKLLQKYDPSNSNFMHKLVRSIAFDQKGGLWVGTFDDGVAKYDPDMQLQAHWNSFKGLPSNDIRHLFLDRNGRMWAASAAGLYRFDLPQTIIKTSDLGNASVPMPKIYGIADGMHNANIRAITDDAQGNVWFSTNRGIGSVNPEDDSITFFTFADGIEPGEFLDRSALNDSDGKIYFGSTSGVCAFDPSNVVISSDAPSVRFTTMAIDIDPNNSYYRLVNLYGKEKIKLKDGENSFSIAFNNADYAMKDKMQYSYRLLGLDDEWRLTDDKNSLTFLNLPAGKYTLQVRSRVRHGQWDSQMATLRISIAPPFYLSWWCKLLYAIVLIALIALILRAYLHSLKLRTSYEIEQQKLIFLTNITHELRTPLTLIAGPLEDIKTSPEMPAQFQGKLDMIHQSTLRLLDLINEILAFRKTEMNGRELRVRREDLANAVYRVGLKYQELNSNQDVKVLIDIEPGDWKMFFDSDAITTIVDNLLSNALKYTPSGHIRLILKKVEGSNPAQAEIRVEDTGYGIPQKELPNIFKRYYQGHGAHQKPGTGIGLALSKNLADQHQAELTVESQEGQGAAFSLKLLIDNTYPDAVHPDAAAQVSEAIGQCENADADAKPVLLIVEDNPDIIKYITQSFEPYFEVLHASNGQEGLDIAYQRMPDVIVSDVMMPVMDGVQMCRSLKTDIRTSHIPIILLTAKTSITDKEEGYKAGADSYITKPFSSTLLHSRINNLLEIRRKMAAKMAEKVSTSSVQQSESDDKMKSKKKHVAEALSKIDADFIDSITRIIEENLASDKLNVDFIAEKMCMSVSSLYRKMRALTGIPTNEFIRRLRMRHAEELLLSRKFSISEIAFKLGFTSPGYFRQCFKEEFGCTPSDYLKKFD